MFRELVEMVPDHRLVYRNQHVAGRAVLTTVDSLGTTRDGVPYEWVVHSLSTVDATGRITAFELFAEEDWEAALARLDELGIAPLDARTPQVENAFTRRRPEWEALVRSGRFDEARARLGEFFADDVVRVDRRPTVAGPDTDGPGMVDSLEAMYELGLVEAGTEPIAVRGDTLALYWQTFRSAGGDELVILNLTETDADNRVVFVANYGEDQLTEALAELDERYLAGEGAEHADVVRPSMDHVAAINRRDWPALLATMRPDIVVGDHRGLWPPESDRNAYLARIRSLAETSPDSVVISRRFVAAGSASLATYGVRGTSDHGERYEYDFHVPALVHDGSFVTFEFFAEDDWDAALARFDELSAPSSDPRTLEIENAATRVARTARTSRGGETPRRPRARVPPGPRTGGTPPLVAVPAGDVPAGLARVPEDLAGAVQLVRRRAGGGTGGWDRRLSAPLGQ